jgi:hypothetical protein
MEDAIFVSISPSSSIHCVDYLVIFPAIPSSRHRAAHRFVRRDPQANEARSFIQCCTAKGSDVSSDEEEHLRMKQTKKARRGVEHRLNKTLSSPDDSLRWSFPYEPPEKPSMFGPELPHRSPPPPVYSQLAPAHLVVQIPALGAHPPPPTHPVPLVRSARSAVCAQSPRVLPAALVSATLTRTTFHVSQWISSRVKVLAKGWTVHSNCADLCAPMSYSISWKSFVSN